MKAIHYIISSTNKRGSILQCLIFPELKIRHSLGYNTDHSEIKVRRDLFENRYNDFLENINSDRISLRFPIESIKHPGKYIDEIVEIYKNPGSLRFDKTDPMIPVFEFYSYKTLGNDLSRLSRDSYRVKLMYIDFDFTTIISKSEIDFKKNSRNIFRDIIKSRNNS